VDPEFADALYGAPGGGASRDGQADRKTRQFCRQVQRALNLALADRWADDGLNEVYVGDVTPAPDCGHLLVHITAPDDRLVASMLTALRQDAPRLRSEIAAATSRKRAPELSFAPAYGAGGAGSDDE
jgi:ribosome-binding factor A